MSDSLKLSHKVKIEEDSEVKPRVKDENRKQSRQTDLEAEGGK